MKLRFNRLSLFGLGGALVAVLLSATAALAQDSSSDGTMPAIFAGGMILFILVICAAIYVYMALALSTTADRPGADRCRGDCLDHQSLAYSWRCSV